MRPALVLLAVFLSGCAQPPPAPAEDPEVVFWQRQWAVLTPFANRKPDTPRPPPRFLACDELPDVTTVDRLCVRLEHVRTGSENVEVCDRVWLAPSLGLNTLLLPESRKAVLRECPACDVLNYEGDLVMASFEGCLQRWGTADDEANIEAGFLGVVDLSETVRITLARDAPIGYLTRTPTGVEMRVFEPR